MAGSLRWGAAFAAVLAVGIAHGAQPPMRPTPGGPIYTPPANQNISGVWWVQRYNAKLTPVDGGALPLTPAAQKEYDMNVAGLKDGSTVDEARHKCLPDGIPRLLGNPYPFEIIQTPGGVITYTYELSGVIRQIVVGQPMPKDNDLEIFPQFLGYSSAKWEGDTLVVETAGFKESTMLDAVGTPHSYEMRVTERIRKLNDKTLEDVVTLTDPETFTKPVQLRYVYDKHPEAQIQEYICGDAHRDISKVPGVAARPQ